MLPSFMGFNFIFWVFTGFWLARTEFYWISLDIIKCFWVKTWLYLVYLVLPSFTEFYRVCSRFTELSGHLTGFHRIVPSFLAGFTGFHLVSTELSLGIGLPAFKWSTLGFDWVWLGLTGFYWALMVFTGFYRVLLGFTGFYWVLTGF